MPVDEAEFQVVDEWLKKAESDLTAAVYLLTLGDECPTEIVCYHVQQCVEKYLKAFLIHEGKPFPRTHDISLLIDVIPAHKRPELLLDEQELLTNYAIMTRYPGHSDEIQISDAEHAVRIARRVRKQVRAQMPDLNFRRKK